MPELSHHEYLWNIYRSNIIIKSHLCFLFLQGLYLKENMETGKIKYSENYFLGGDLFWLFWFCYLKYEYVISDTVNFNKKFQMSFSLIVVWLSAC